MERNDRDTECRGMAGLMDLYVDGALSEESGERIERHLMRCARCSFEVRTLEQARAHLLQALPRTESSPAFREKMMARLSDAFADVLQEEPSGMGSQREFPFLLESL